MDLPREVVAGILVRMMRWLFAAALLRVDHWSVRRHPERRRGALATLWFAERSARRPAAKTFLRGSPAAAIE
jgi:hypothetical protein